MDDIGIRAKYEDIKKEYEEEDARLLRLIKVSYSKPELYQTYIIIIESNQNFNRIDILKKIIL